MFSLARIDDQSRRYITAVFSFSLRSCAMAAAVPTSSTMVSDRLKHESVPAVWPSALGTRPPAELIERMGTTADWIYRNLMQAGREHFVPLQAEVYRRLKALRTQYEQAWKSHEQERNRAIRDRLTGVLYCPAYESPYTGHQLPFHGLNTDEGLAYVCAFLSVSYADVVCVRPARERIKEMTDAVRAMQASLASSASPPAPVIVDACSDALWCMGKIASDLDEYHTLCRRDTAEEHKAYNLVHRDDFYLVSDRSTFATLFANRVWTTTVSKRDASGWKETIRLPFLGLTGGESNVDNVAYLSSKCDAVSSMIQSWSRVKIDEYQRSVFRLVQHAMESAVFKHGWFAARLAIATAPREVDRTLVGLSALALRWAETSRHGVFQIHGDSKQSTALKWSFSASMKPIIEDALSGLNRFVEGVDAFLRTEIIENVSTRTADKLRVSGLMTSLHSLGAVVSGGLFSTADLRFGMTGHGVSALLDPQTDFKPEKAPIMAAEQFRAVYAESQRRRWEGGIDIRRKDTGRPVRITPGINQRDQERYIADQMKKQFEILSSRLFVANTQKAREGLSSVISRIFVVWETRDKAIPAPLADTAIRTVIEPVDRWIVSCFASDVKRLVMHVVRRLHDVCVCGLDVPSAAPPTDAAYVKLSEAASALREHLRVAILYCIRNPSTLFESWSMDPKQPELPAFFPSTAHALQQMQLQLVQFARNLPGATDSRIRAFETDRADIVSRLETKEFKLITSQEYWTHILSAALKQSTDDVKIGLHESAKTLMELRDRHSLRLGVESIQQIGETMEKLDRGEFLRCVSGVLHTDPFTVPYPPSRTGRPMFTQDTFRAHVDSASARYGEGAERTAYLRKMYEMAAEDKGLPVNSDLGSLVSWWLPVLALNSAEELKTEEAAARRVFGFSDTATTTTTTAAAASTASATMDLKYVPTTATAASVAPRLSSASKATSSAYLQDMYCRAAVHLSERREKLLEQALASRSVFETLYNDIELRFSIAACMSRVITVNATTASPASSAPPSVPSSPVSSSVAMRAL